MARHDWRRGRGDRYGQRDYGSDFGRWGDEWGSSPSAGIRDRGVGLYRDWGTPSEAPRYPGPYDADVYGGGYPGYGGYPGSRRAGIHYGGYDAPYARGPFLPEEAYRRHPRIEERPARHLTGRWPEEPHGIGMGRQMDDRDVDRFVRQSLYADRWIDPERLEVEVDHGVVTLRGEVDDYMEARYAWDDAWESPGVRGVVNRITVRMDREIGDEGDPMVQTEGE